MAKATRRARLRTTATLIATLVIGICLGVAVVGWVAGWQTVDQYSTALRLAGLAAAGLGLLSVLGNQAPRAGDEFGAASLEIAHAQTRGQPDYFQEANRSFSFLVIMAVVGALVAGAGVALSVLVG